MHLNQAFLKVAKLRIKRETEEETFIQKTLEGMKRDVHKIINF
jgi:hypothetical protein